MSAALHLFDAVADTADRPERDSAPAATGTAALRRLDLTRFRSYARLRLELAPAMVVLTGANGAGKTNLLEAISFLAPGRGLRRALLSEPTQHAPEAPARGGWTVAARLETAAGTVQLGTGLVEAGERRVVHIDGVAVRGQMPLAEQVSVQWLVPEMDRLFDGPASARRRFLDRVASGFDPAHASRLSGYALALRERARLLAAGGADPAWLSALEERLAELGVAIAATRRACLRRLAAAVPAVPAPFPAVGLALACAVAEAIADAPALAVEESLRRALCDGRAADAASGSAAAGPHKADLHVTHADKGRAAAACSTGEQKALLIALALAGARAAETDSGRPPLLLLDEVAAHLDRARREALFAALCDRRGQTWLAGAEAEPFAALRGHAQFLSVQPGQVAHD